MAHSSPGKVLHIRTKLLHTEKEQTKTANQLYDGLKYIHTPDR